MGKIEILSSQGLSTLKFAAFWLENCSCLPHPLTGVAAAYARNDALFYARSLMFPNFTISICWSFFAHVSIVLFGF